MAGSNGPHPQVGTGDMVVENAKNNYGPLLTGRDPQGGVEDGDGEAC